MSGTVSHILDGFGPTLERSLRSRHWSQGRLARELGVAEKTVNRWVKGRSRPRAEVYEALVALMPEMAPRELADRVRALEVALRAVAARLDGEHLHED